MTGKIVKGIAGFYYVHVPNKGIYECKAKGIFRNRNEKPLVGDKVELDILDDNNMTGNITSILPRFNRLVRPAVANVDQAVVVFAVTDPEPNFHLLDCFLVRMMYEEVPVIICFNKDDLADEDRINELLKIYEKSGCRVLTINTGVTDDADEDAKKDCYDKLYGLLEGKTTVLAGPSGVGKSSIMNMLCPEANAQTGVISEKLGRGKHTTRHSEIFCIGGDSYVMDTPGFSSLTPPPIEASELGKYYNEFTDGDICCRFLSCIHKDEPDCGVKERVADGRISSVRYEGYLYILEEIKKQKKW